jgi:DNA-binding winged helix-turn-helix (wHTH) protein
MIARFGRFTFDSGRHLLLDGDRAATVSPKAFQLLELLLRHAPNMVSKESIAAAVWTDDAPSDASLAMAVTELRKALGESGERPHFIRTVHRRGYAFTGEVERLDAAPPLPAASARQAGGATTAPQFWLTVGDRSVVLPEGEAIVGRDPASTVWIDNPSVSRRHARFVVSGESVFVEDLGSLNGTRLEGRPVKGRASVREGDAIVIGDVSVVFRSSVKNARTPTRPLGPRK